MRRRRLARAQFLGEGRGIAVPADRGGGVDHVRSGTSSSSRAARVDAANAVGEIAHPPRLQRERPRRAGIVAVGEGGGGLARLPVGERQSVREDVDEQCRMLRPVLVERHQQADESLPMRVAAMGVEEAPRLGVERRGRPARRLEHRLEVALRHERAVERARRPALQEQRIDRMVAVAGSCFDLWASHSSPGRSWGKALPERTMPVVRRLTQAVGIVPAGGGGRMLLSPPFVGGSR